MQPQATALYTFAWAAAFGLLAQILARRWRVPPLAPLLVLGVLLGPSVLGWVNPAALGIGLGIIVKLAVAIILFDGAMNLRLGDLRRSARDVRRLVTIGALATWIGATLAARFVAGLGWQASILFGALLIVTGPTVVQPLLKRVDLPRRVKVVLEGEAILIDPIGAILAVTILDLIMGLAGAREIGVLSLGWALFGRILIGLVVGTAGAFLLSRLLKVPRLVPPDLGNIVSVAMVWTIFAFAELLHDEAGIMAVVAMGLAMQRGAVPQERRLRRFKEQLTVLGISLLFILLTASLPVASIVREGWRGPMTVLALMFVVRPACVFIALRGSEMPVRERLFVAWIGPRGVVAASVASLFALSFAAAGIPGGQRLFGLTFLTIAMTVMLQGSTANLVARLLGLHSMHGQRAIIVGAGPLGRAIALLMRDGDRPVTIVDRNPNLVAASRAQGIEYVIGNALDEETLDRAGAEEAQTLVAATTNSEVNLLAAQLARDAFAITHAYPALAEASRGATEELALHSGALAAFAAPIDVRWWDDALQRGVATIVPVDLPPNWRSREADRVQLADSAIPLVRVRGTSASIVHSRQQWDAGDRIMILTSDAERAARDLLDGASGRASPAAGVAPASDVAG